MELLQLKRVNRVVEVLYIAEIAKGGVGTYLFICIFTKAIHKVTSGELLIKQDVRKNIIHKKYIHA